MGVLRTIFAIKTCENQQNHVVSLDRVILRKKGGEKQVENMATF